MNAGIPEIAAESNSYLLVLAIILPIAGILLSFGLGGRQAERCALLAISANLCVALAIAAQIWKTSAPIIYILGGWAPPLGIMLRADGFSAVMLVTTGLVTAAVAIFARANFETPRLKLLIAYSTVAQIGYLFIMFPLAGGLNSWSTEAFSGGVMQLLSHAFAKAAMFLSAGLVAEALGHDRIEGFHGHGRAVPLTVLTFGLGGMSLMGLPPSGGFIAKWLLLKTSVEAGQWFGRL